MRLLYSCVIPCSYCTSTSTTYGYGTIKTKQYKKTFFGAWSREGAVAAAVRPHAAGVRSKIRIIILTGKTLCISRSTRMVYFRQKNHLQRKFFLTDAKAIRTGVRTRATDPTFQMGPQHLLIINRRKTLVP
jgi:hypothetical protein